MSNMDASKPSGSGLRSKGRNQYNPDADHSRIGDNEANLGLPLPAAPNHADLEYQEKDSWTHGWLGPEVRHITLFGNIPRKW
jgi:hypothetical protein